MKLLNILIVLILLNLSNSAFSDWSIQEQEFTDSALGCIDCLDTPQSWEEETTH